MGWGKVGMLSKEHPIIQLRLFVATASYEDCLLSDVLLYSESTFRLRDPASAELGEAKCIDQAKTGRTHN